MATTSISVLGLLVLLVVIGLPLLVVLGLTYIAITRKNWSGLALLAMMFGGLIGAVLLWGYSSHHVSRTEAAVVRAEAEARTKSLRELARQIAMQEKQTASTQESSRERLPWETTAEVASDEELAAVASAQPKIKLEDIDPADKPVYNNLKNTAEPHPIRPDWIDAHLGDNQKLIVSGPFTTKDSCESDTKEQLANWLNLKFGAIGGTLSWPTETGFDPSPFVKSQYEEIRDTSVGEVHLLYTLAEVAPEVQAQIAKSLADAAARVARTRGVRAVTFAGASVLSLVALAHVVLRSGGRKPKSNAA
ncbi:hypothetical protein [Botrimarina mediterranea]|uniref:Uncharacterized protein n=1 Tax=Botrimarina mediterranea TaxID=2528022 RepID=A0A518KEU3_9BACT|nr:hypothetical protein [Botrimarina mediterranea]QDV76293.1 hypothetical protein Spa11_45230 [Botrimarina mediterranea]